MSISKFDVNVYSDELHQVSEAEHDEVMMLMADDEQDWQGYSEWSADIEQANFEREQERKSTVETERGAVMIVRDCNHTACKTSRCEIGLRLGGFDL
jgi:hypothetical protein